DHPLQLRRRRVEVLGQGGDCHVEGGVAREDDDQVEAQDGQRPPPPFVDGVGGARRESFHLRTPLATLNRSGGSGSWSRYGTNAPVVNPFVPAARGPLVGGSGLRRVEAAGSPALS